MFDKIKELVGELHELHKTELTKLQDSQELESQQFIGSLYSYKFLPKYDP